MDCVSLAFLAPSNKTQTCQECERYLHATFLLDDLSWLFVFMLYRLYVMFILIFLLGLFLSPKLFSFLIKIQLYKTFFFDFHNTAITVQSLVCAYSWLYCSSIYSLMLLPNKCLRYYEHLVTVCIF